MTGRLAIGFDFDHTLGLDNGLETKAMFALAAELGRPLDPLAASTTSVIDDALGRFRLMTITLDACVDEVVSRLELPASPAPGERYREICYGLVDELVVPISGARELIAALAEYEIPNAILTNGWSPLQSLKIARALDYRGPILVSADLGILKPDPAVFVTLAQTLGVAREQILFVGDNPHTDILGAQGAGLRGVWFDWEHVAYPPDAPVPDHRITELAEVLDLVRGSAVLMEKRRA